VRKRRLFMNIKIRFMAMVSILIFGGLFVLADSPSAQDAKAFVGDWSGVISGDGQELEIVCHFKLNESGALTGTIDSPAQGAVGLAISDIKIEGKKISFGIDDPNVGGDPLFEGTLDETGTKISGDFSQGGGAATFELIKQ
jgi:hypothetical protein